MKKERKQAPTQLFLRTTGGMGISLEGSVDVDALPDDLARQVATELTPRKLSRVVRRKAVTFVPGQQEYEIALATGEDGELKRYAFTDQQADPELLDLLDELTATIIQAKMRARRTRRQPKREEQGKRESREKTPSPTFSNEGITDPATPLRDIAEPIMEEKAEDDALMRASEG